MPINSAGLCPKIELPSHRCKLLISLKNSSDIHYRNLNRSFSYFEPEFSFSFFHSNNNRELTISYKNYLGHKAPGMDLIFPIVDNIDQYNILFGNPYLKNENTFSNKLSWGYIRSKRNSKNFFSISGEAILDRVANAISDSVINDNAGRRKVYPVNVIRKTMLNTTLEVTYSTKLKNQLLQFQYSGGYHISRVPGYINSSYIVSDYHTFKHTFGVTYAISEKLTTEMSQSISINKFQFSSEDEVPVRNNLYRTSLNANLNLTPRCILSSASEYVKSTYLQKQFILWNMYLTYRFLKSEQLELKFSAFDILRKYSNVNMEVGYDYNSTRVSSGLQQFFMLGVSFYPRRFERNK